MVVVVVQWGAQYVAEGDTGRDVRGGVVPSVRDPQETTGVVVACHRPSAVDVAAVDAPTGPGGTGEMPLRDGPPEGDAAASMRGCEGACGRGGGGRVPQLAGACGGGVAPAGPHL